MKPKYILVWAILLLIALALAACSGQPAPTQAPVLPTAIPCPTSAPAPACPPAPTPVVQNVPNQDAWANSAHNDAKAEAFTHWDTASPKEVPTDCAKCHSTPGYQDYLGADGSKAGVVDKAAPTGTTITCVACHNSATATLTSVTFPSGVVINNLGPEARCMVCHQGRESTVSVNNALEKAGVNNDLDKVSSDLSFINIHYFAAAATLYGAETQGGYQYPGMSYDVKNDHVAGYDTCIGCHDPHTLQVKVNSCATCHTNVKTVDDLKNIRMNGSLVDYNGNGNITEGIYYEIQGLQNMLMQAIQAYAKEVAKSPIVYDANTYPYFFIDTNGNGTADPDELQSSNAYKSWTGRLVEATYNYQMSIKDPGAFAHNSKYVIELLYDSIADLNTKLSTPIDLSKAHRVDPGHFNGSDEPFRHWDTADNGLVPATCVKCHTSTGLPFFIQNGVTIAMQPTDGLSCNTCHDDLTTFTRYQVKQVTFPSGATLSLDNTDANLCISCHQGRESTVSVNAAIQKANVGPDQESDALTFINSHYFPAGATLFGTEAKGAYEFAGKQYNGQFTHVDAFNSCVECHDVHKLTVNTDKCSTCHGSTDPTTFRNPSGDTTDYDGDGNVTEGIAGEVQTMQEKLLAAMQDYTTSHNLDPIGYSGANYPYYFKDTNGDGQISSDEATSDNAYKTWTPNLLRAAYNYQWVTKDPGAYAHNGMYIMQILYDSIEAVGGNTSGMTRPPVTPPATQ